MEPEAEVKSRSLKELLLKTGTSGSDTGIMGRGKYAHTNHPHIHLLPHMHLQY